jgi:hypothetical protein
VSWRKTRDRKLSLEFIPLHIVPFQQDGKWFARAMEFEIVGHGESEMAATRNVFNMVLRSVFVAASQGTLPTILKKAGVKIMIGVPQDDATQAGQKDLWFLPLTQSADHLSAP